MKQRKKEFREHYKNLRNCLSNEENLLKSNKIMDALVQTEWYKNSKVIMTYINFKSEVITEYFIRKALESGKRIVVPVVDYSTKTLNISEIKDFDLELNKGSYNILEPKKEYIRKVDPSEIDLVLVPGLVFSIDGYRIGYGGGYYDKLLSQLGTHTIMIGVAFDFQVATNIPIEEFDQKVDCIITEERILKI